MALVAYLKLHELCYNSPIPFCIHDDGRVEATYETNLTDEQVLDPKLSSAQKLSRRGNARLDGRVTERISRSIVIEGTWHHDPGPLTEGIFKLNLDLEASEAVGWWSESSKPEVQHEWKLTPPVATALETFMVRYSFVTSIAFLLLTLYSLLEAAFLVNYADNVARHAVGTTIQTIYTIVYSSFLLHYAHQEEEKRPAPDYVGGVAAYTAGYAAFLILAACNLTSATPSPTLLHALFVVGSFAFLLGSLLLVWALRKANVASALIDGGTFFLAGSWAFLFGSFVFVGWSMYGGNAVMLGTLGNSLFLLGRVLFASGSYVILK